MLNITGVCESLFSVNQQLTNLQTMAIHGVISFKAELILNWDVNMNWTVRKKCK